MVDQCAVCGKDWDTAGMLFSCEQCREEMSYCQDHKNGHQHVKPEPKQNISKQENNEDLLNSTSQQHYIPKGQSISNTSVLRLVPNSWTAGAEWKDLVIASFVLTFIFIFNLALDFPDLEIPDQQLLNNMLMIGVLVSIAFIFHELSHKFTAQYYGHDSRFVLNVLYIAISLVLALANFAFIWVGAAVVLAKHGMGDEYGKIAAAGPFSNLLMGSIAIVLFVIFEFLGMLQTTILDYALSDIIEIFVYLNGFIGLFNMIPFGMLDGAKIWAWNSSVWIYLAVGLGSLWFVGFNLSNFIGV